MPIICYTLHTLQIFSQLTVRVHFESFYHHKQGLVPICYNIMVMNIAFGILGAFLAIALELASPWSEVIMAEINGVLASPSISSFPGLPALITILGVICAYLLLPCIGFLVGSKS